MTAPTLKPCPFCGGEAEMVGNASRSSVYCRGCGTRAGRQWESPENAALRWNRRVEPAEEAHKCFAGLGSANPDLCAQCHAPIPSRRPSPGCRLEVGHLKLGHEFEAGDGADVCLCNQDRASHGTPHEMEETR